MSTFKQSWGTVRDFTITLASLATSATAGRESTAVTSNTDDCLDYLVQIGFKVASGAGSGSDDTVYVYLYGSVDGTNYSGDATGSDAAITTSTRLVLAQTVYCPTSNATYKGAPFCVAQFFGGSLPAKWGIVIRNYADNNFSSTAGDHFAKYQAVYGTST